MVKAKLAPLVTLPELPYKMNELAPIISEAQLEDHYKNHHQVYVHAFNLTYEAIKCNTFLTNQPFLKKVFLQKDLCITNYCENNLNSCIHYIFSNR